MDSLVGRSVRRLALYSTVPEDSGILGQVEPFAEGDSVFMYGVRRHKFLEDLVENALHRDIEIHWEHKVDDIDQGDDFVRVKFENGETATASFAVGCDGLHSNTRTSLFGKEQATYTGLVQVGGFSKIPLTAAFETPTFFNFFGNGVHIVTYPINETHCSWAITRREPETKESWRAVDDSTLEEIRNDPTSGWAFGAGELVKTAETVVKYGLYDRPQLERWYKGRVVLVGDAAHPTSPHIGQGANQAFEDVYHLVRVLLKFNPDGSSPSTEALGKAFDEYEQIRLPRTARLVKEARKIGESRVLQGVEPCKIRNAFLRELWSDKDKVAATYLHIMTEPFSGEPEI